MQFVNKENAPKVFMCASAAVMLCAMIASRFLRKNEENERTPENELRLKKEKSKKPKPKLNNESNTKFKHDNFLTDYDNYLQFSDELEDEVVTNSSLLKKPKTLTKNHRPFLSDNEDTFRFKKKRNKSLDRSEAQMNEFYFAMMKN